MSLNKKANAQDIDENINATDSITDVQSPVELQAPRVLIPIRDVALDSLEFFGTKDYPTNSLWVTKWNIASYDVFKVGDLRINTHNTKFKKDVEAGNVSEIRYTPGTPKQGGTSYFEWSTYDQEDKRLAQSAKRASAKFTREFLTLENINANPALAEKLALGSINAILNASS